MNYVLAYLFGHNPMETHSLILINDRDLVVDVELPWTVNEAARLYYQIQKGDLISDAETALYLKAYVLSHFHIIQNEQDLIPLKMEEIPLEHGHSIKYRIDYPINKAGNIIIENLNLLELFGDDQKNYVTVLENKNLMGERMLSEEDCTLEIPVAISSGRSLWVILNILFQCIFW